jgi:inhibitor of KinA
MYGDGVRFFPLGQGALTVDFGNVISEELNRRAIALADLFDKHPFPGLVEAVPAYASTTIFYDPLAIQDQFPDSPSAFAAVKLLVEGALRDLAVPERSTVIPTIIPVKFDPGSAPDLPYVSEACKLSKTEVIEIFTSLEYRVYMLGFLPGFPYLGQVDPRIAVPRLDSPRLSVPKGSVGIAGRQTGIYPMESPGGWRIIGRTELEIFTPDNDDPCRLRPGDVVKFTVADQ